MKKQMANDKSPPSRLNNAATIPANEREAFAQDVGVFMQAGIDIGENPISLVEYKIVELAALAKTLRPDSAFAEHYLHHLVACINAIIGDTETPVTIADVKPSAEAFLQARSLLTLQFADLLCDPDFIESLPEAVKGMAFDGLSDRNIEAMAKKLAQKDQLKLPITVANHSIPPFALQSALRMLYHPTESPLIEPLKQSLKHFVPSLPEERMDCACYSWLYRQIQAIGITDDCLHLNREGDA